MKKTAVIAVLMAMVLTLSIFGGSYLPVLAQDVPVEIDVAEEDVTPDQEDGEPDQLNEEEAATEPVESEEEETQADPSENTDELVQPEADTTEPAEPDGNAQPQADAMDDTQEQDDTSAVAFAPMADVGTLALSELNVYITAEANNIKMTWDRIDGANKYEVLRALDENGPFTVIATLEGTFPSEIGYADLFLLESAEFYYQVKAYNGTQLLDESEVVYEYTDDFFNALGLRAAAVDSESIKLNWILDDDSDYVKIYRSESREGPFEFLDDADTLEYIDTNLQAGKTYYYGISSYGFENNYACMLATGPVSATTKAASVPGAPHSLEADALDTESVHISWTPGTGEAQGYYIYRADRASGPYSQVGTATDAEYTDTGLEAGKAYYYKVAAYNQAGTSAQSSYKSVKTKTAGLPAPQGVTATTLDATRIQLKWNAVSGATRYYIYRSEELYGTYEQVGTTTSTVHTNSWLQPNTDYYYVVVAYSFAAGLGEQSVPVPASTGASLPGAPTGIAAEGIDSTTIRVAWNDVSGATSYIIYRASTRTGTYEQIGESSVPRYEDSALTANTTYYYKVAAKNSAGTGPMSGYTDGKTLSGGPSDAPQDVAAEALDGHSIKVSWSPVTGATGYFLYRSSSYNGTYVFVGTVTGTDYINTGLQPMTGYYYKVAAYNATGTGPQSAYAHAVTMSVDPPPYLLTATALDSSRIQLNWNAVSGATGYYIYRSDSANGSYERVGSTAATSFINTGLVANTGYFYKVAAYNATETGLLSPYAYAKTLAGGPTEAPVNVIATTLDSSRIQVSWSSVTGATGYYVYRSTTYNGTYEQVGNTATTSFINTGLTANTGYYYKVAAYNAEGVGPQSAYAYAKTYVDGPGEAPQNISAVGLDSSRIQVTWSGVTGAAGYQIYRSVSQNGTYTYVGSSSTTNFINAGLAPNTGYYYKVAAYNANGVGPQSASAYAVTKGGAPTQAPANVTAVGLDTSRIQVSWSAVSDATGYYVYRSSTAYGQYSYVGSTTTTSFINTSLAPSTGYYYVVTAYNSAGAGPQSAYAYGETKGPNLIAPTINAVTQSSSSILVAWSNVPGGNTYYLYGATSANGPFSLINVGSTTFYYFHNGLAPNTTYYYKVAAVVNGVLGPESTIASATTKQNQVITQQPTYLTATALDTNRIQLNWTGVPNAKGYYIYMSTSPYGTYSYNGVAYSTNAVVSNLMANTTYYFKVAAFNDYGTGPQSAYASARTKQAVSRPNAPRWVKACALDKYRILVNWETVSNADGYYIYRAKSACGTYSLVGTSKTASFIDMSINRCTRYYYRVVAYNSAGQSPMSCYANVKTK